MTPNTRYFARVLFKLKVHESHGVAYENLFAHVMQYSRPGFNKIKPYGKQGDRGNDGYEKVYGRYFQLYAPEEPKQSIAEAIRKAEIDFADKLLPYWGSFCEVKEYFFVFNDKYRGTNYVLEQTLAAIAHSHSLSVANVYLSRDLEDEFMRLDEDQMSMIIGGLPNENATTMLDFSVVKEVLQHLQEMPLPNVNPGHLNVPDIDEKIKFNGLGDFEHSLKAKQLETWQIDDYFRKNSEFAKQNLRDHLAFFYSESLTLYPDEQNSGLRFVHVLQKIAPKTTIPAHDRLRRDIALILMAKYFETCDIFKEPS